MRNLEVGKIFEEGKTRYQEGVKFDFDNAGGKLFLFFKNPTGSEIEDISKGNMKIGLFEKNTIIFMLWKFGNQDWMDTPYCVHLSKGLVLEQVEPEMGYGIIIFLINANTGILEAMRFISMSEKFSRNFYAAVKKQRLYMFDEHSYNRDLNEVYKSYTTDLMVYYANTEKVGK